MFFNQPLAARFGTELSDALSSGKWTHLEIAVAWVRASGLRHLQDAFASFLQRGGSLSTIVGVDLDNTSREGLQALIDLERLGDSRSYVYHNEAGTIFHPKLYLFHNLDGEARLIVGSNNLTEAGLFRNTEAGLQLDLAVGDPTIQSARNALATWTDPASGLSRILTGELLASLIENEYVKSEAAIRREIAERRVKEGARQKKLAKLFASVPITAPALKDEQGVPDGKQRAGGKNRAPENALTQESPVRGNALLMRLRRASSKDRRTQTQLPKAVAGSQFFLGATALVSTQSGEKHELRPARARDIINTIKLEIPEMRDFEDPVARFERTDEGVRYEVYDSSSARGQAIKEALLQGRLPGAPNPTSLTLPRDPARSTWWRFI